MKTYDKFNGKRILIWGYGREGKSTERFLQTYCSPKSVKVFEGKREDINESSYDYIIKSPGIVMDEDNEKYTSQTQIFLENFRDNTVGITGTKGKSTTSALLHHVLMRAGKNTVLLGNIGEPCLDHFGSIDEDTVVVFEMSCHQLAHVTVSPHVAVFLNLYEEHLDYYRTFERYFAAKCNITKYQRPDDYLFAGGNVPRLVTDAETVRIDFNSVPDYDMKIIGHHNNYNAHFVYRIATGIFGADDAAVRSAISDFTGLSHRLQHAGSRGGIDFYDDSISTIPSATIEAISAVSNARTILIGGMDRGINYDALTDFINSHTEYNYIFSYDSGKRIFDSVNRTGNCYYAATLGEAVKLAVSITPEGYAVILSPASASYGYFKNFEERGEEFCRLCGLKDDGAGAGDLAEAVLTFTGDIGFDGYMKEKWKDENLLAPEVAAFLKDSNHVIANVEGPVYDGGTVARENSVAALLHSIDPDACSFLTGIGADVWNICNNHIMDAGAEGMKSTIAHARANSVRTVGAGMNINEASSPLIINEAGGIGMIGVGYQRACRKASDEMPGCFSWSDLDLINARIKEIKKRCRWCIVIAHAGEEFTALPSPYTRERYLTYLEMGADIVIAHHPHVVNNYELIGDKAIFYSLGNFIFDTDYQRSQMYTEHGVLLKMRFTPDQFSFEPLGITIDRTSGRICKSDVPDIFIDVPAEEYEKLKGLAAAVLIANTKRQLIYLKPTDFETASEDDFVRNFNEPLRSGRVPGETLDMQIIYPLSLTARDGEWKKSGLKKAISYMLSQTDIC